VDHGKRWTTDGGGPQTGVDHRRGWTTDGGGPRIARIARIRRGGRREDGGREGFREVGRRVGLSEGRRLGDCIALITIFFLLWDGFGFALLMGFDMAVGRPRIIPITRRGMARGSFPRPRWSCSIDGLEVRRTEVARSLRERLAAWPTSAHRRQPSRFVGRSDGLEVRRTLGIDGLEVRRSLWAATIDARRNFSIVFFAIALPLRE
jgi:hypothetical protein